MFAEVTRNRSWHIFKRSLIPIYNVHICASLAISFERDYYYAGVRRNVSFYSSAVSKNIITITYSLISLLIRGTVHMHFYTRTQTRHYARSR